MRFPNLYLDFWTEETIGRIASVLGFPIKLDHVTKGMIRLSFARVLVEINTNFSFLKQIPILDVGDNITWQKVIYEWTPLKCSVCLFHGYSDRRCNSTKAWLPK